MPEENSHSKLIRQVQRDGRFGNSRKAIAQRLIARYGRQICDQSVEQMLHYVRRFLKCSKRTLERVLSELSTFGYLTSRKRALTCGGFWQPLPSLRKFIADDEAQDAVRESYRLEAGARALAKRMRFAICDFANRLAPQPSKQALAAKWLADANRDALSAKSGGLSREEYISRIAALPDREHSDRKNGIATSDLRFPANAGENFLRKLE